MQEHDDHIQVQHWHQVHQQLQQIDTEQQQP